MSVTVKIPTQLRAATSGEAEIAVEGSTVGEVLDAVFDQHDGLRDRITQDGDLRLGGVAGGGPQLGRQLDRHRHHATPAPANADSKSSSDGAISDSERVVAIITGEGLKTLDAVREGFEIAEIEPRVEAFDAKFAAPAVA